LAQRLQCLVVHDFRSADLALGGQGAPLVPAVDALLFRSESSDRVLLNIGGVANATWLPKGRGTDGVVGFDSGPGNLLIDLAARWESSGTRLCDRNGQHGLRGHVDAGILQRLLDLPVLSTPPPRSFGREDFGEGLFRELLRWRAWSERPDDLFATLAAWTARATVDAFRKWIPTGPCEMLVAGGGARNAAVMRALADDWAPGRVGLQSELGVPEDAKEAYAFAVLADCTLRGIPTSLPAVTGASRAAILGNIAFP
jgi:anhydro-N-acetylmuramic acid kinase